jgi:hypothetical protein
MVPCSETLRGIFLYDLELESEKYYQDIYGETIPTNYENYFECELFLEK